MPRRVRALGCPARLELRKELARIDLSRNTQLLAMSCPAQKMQSETELEFSLLDSQADRATALQLHTSADLFQSADQIGKQLKNRGRKKNILQLLVRTNGRACGTVSLHVVDQRIQILEEKQGSEIPAPMQGVNTASRRVQKTTYNRFYISS